MSFAKSLLIALAVSAAPFSKAPAQTAGRPGPVAAAPKAARPNVIFILVDDLGFGQVGANGEKRIATPNLDRMAAEGVNFTQAYAGAPVCSPSRIALLTGRDSKLMQAHDNNVELRKEDRTVAHLLQASGYETALIGKFGVGTRFGINDPMAMGFSTWYGILDNISAHRQYPVHLFRDNAMIPVDENIGGHEGAYAQKLFADEAIRFVKEKRDRPFFLYLSFTSPHAELAAPAEFVDPYRGKFQETPYAGNTGAGPKSPFVRYYPKPVDAPNATTAGMISALDHYVGQLLGALKEAGIDQETLVVFTSDNGPHEEGGADPRYMQAGGPYRGFKRDLYEGGIHVPMIARWPGVVKAGRVEDTPVAFLDVLPTLAELAGTRPTAVPGVASNGLSLAPLLRDGEARLPDRTIYWEFARIPGALEGGSADNVTQAARRGRWKAVRYGAKSAVQLYDLDKDPGETKDLAGSRAALARDFQQMFDRELANPAPNLAVSPMPDS